MTVACCSSMLCVFTVCALDLSVLLLARMLDIVCLKGCLDILSLSRLFLMPAICLREEAEKSVNISLSYLKYCLRLSWYAICTDRDPHPFCDSRLVEKKDPCKCQAKYPAAQMSRWPFGCTLFCLLYVEVSFCCMRRSAVSLGCSEPGWERWREGTAQTHRLHPEWRMGAFSQNMSVPWSPIQPRIYPAVPKHPLAF